MSNEEKPQWLEELTKRIELIEKSLADLMCDKQVTTEARISQLESLTKTLKEKVIALEVKYDLKKRTSLG